MIKNNSLPYILFLGLVGTFFLAFPDVKYDQLLTDEDSWLENISAIAFLFASVLFFVVFGNSKGKGNQVGKLRTQRNLVYLFLGLLFFVAFGEEISWGQRIFGWATPEAWQEVNYQQETNIHNLDFFHFKNEGDDSLIAKLLVFNAGRLFFYFWFVYLLLLPLLNRFSTKSRQLLEKINIPIAPTWTGLLMLSNLILSKIFKAFTANNPGDFPGSIDEIMEMNYALIIAVTAIWFFRKSKSQKNHTTSPSFSKS